MNFGVALIAVGGFLLGGAYSVAQLNDRGTRRSGGQLAIAAVLLLIALYLIVVGIIRLVTE